MTAFLAWYGEQGYRVGEGERLAEELPAPALVGHDLEVWNFYCAYATPFVQEFGMMPRLYARAAGKGVASEIFLDKLTAIHDKVQEIRARRAEEAAKASARPGDTILAADPT